MTEENYRSRPSSRRADPALLLERIEKLQLPTLVPDSEVYTKNGKSHIVMRCTACSMRQEKVVANLLAGVSRNCLGCIKKWDTKAQTLLAKRYSACKSRCEVPGTKDYKHYGERGIQLRFSSVDEFVSWVLENLPHPTYQGVDIDRIDNNGHYEPGNLRLVSRRENCLNKVNNVLVNYLGLDVPISHVWHLMRTDYPEMTYRAIWVHRLLSEGMSVQQILEKHKKRQADTRGYTTSLTPDPDIVSLYRGK
jgi:hypothetical protein